MPRKASNPASATIPQADIDEVIAAHNGTVVTTNTTVEDRTDRPEEAHEVAYEAEVRELEGGTILTSYGAAVEA
jgi:hypothetical protein